MKKLAAFLSRLSSVGFSRSEARLERTKLARGIVPDDFAEFAAQKSAWKTRRSVPTQIHSVQVLRSNVDRLGRSYHHTNHLNMIVSNCALYCHLAFNFLFFNIASLTSFSTRRDVKSFVESDNTAATQLRKLSSGRTSTFLPEFDLDLPTGRYSCVIMSLPFPFCFFTLGNCRRFSVSSMLYAVSHFYRGFTLFHKRIMGVPIWQ